MTLPTFKLFPKLPPEIRDTIWKFTIRPRLVSIKEASNSQSHRPYVDQPRNLHLFSSSLVPYTLHTCQESRAVMIKCGYVLAFGTPSQEPTIWFNFESDILYLEDSRKAFGDAYNSNEQPFFKRISPDDASRITAMAMGGSMAHRPNFADFRSFIPFRYHLSALLKYFSRLKEFLVVETMHGKSTNQDFAVRSEPRNVLLEWLECDVAEAQGHCSPEGDVVTYRYREAIMEYRRKNRCDGQDFFRQLTVKLEKEQIQIRDEATRRGDISWHIPNFKVVQAMSIYSSWRMKSNRDTYWAGKIEEERKEAETLARPLSPFSTEFEEEIDILRFDWQ